MSRRRLSSLALMLLGSACAAPITPGGDAPADEKGDDAPALVGINGVGAGYGCSNGTFGQYLCYGSARTRWAIDAEGGTYTHLFPSDADVSDPKAASDEQLRTMAKGLLDSVDCLVMRGGKDIPPEEYDQEPDETVSTMDEGRYRFDTALIKEALERRMPVLGICLGMQEMNVVRDGRLVQDIPSDERYVTETRGPIDHRSQHGVRFVEDTIMASLYDQTPEDAPLWVHSNHHQMPDPAHLGRGFIVSGHAVMIDDDGNEHTDHVVEAIELGKDEHPFAVGVQYHPEHHREGRHSGLMRGFLDACVAHRRSRSE